MAQFELNTYGENDEILKTFATDKVRWGLLSQGLALAKSMEDDGMSPEEQFVALNEYILKIFPGMTAADLDMADTDDVMNTFRQIIRKGQNIGANQKNG